MFDEIRIPKIAALACEDSLGYEPAIYFDTLILVASQVFSKQEKASGLQARFVLDRMKEINSVAELSSSIKSAMRFPFSLSDLGFLTHLLSDMLGRVSSDPRSFSIAVLRERLVDVFHQFLMVMRRASIQTEEFETAVRRFLTKNLRGEVCGDVPWVANGSASIPAEVVALNQVIAKPIERDDVQPTKTGVAAADVRYWRSSDAKKMLQMAKSLRFGAGTLELSVEERKKADWHQKLVEFLNAVEVWKSEVEASEDDYFHQRCILYGVALELCPDILQRDAVLRSHLKFLKEANRKFASNINWLMEVKEYLSRLGFRNRSLPESLIEPMLNSGDETLRIYGEMISLLAQPPAK